jgi:leucyl/phenylalanyl-tRNA---protein transferase
MPVFQLPEEIIFPDVSFAEKDGLLALGGDLCVERLLSAYSHGIFPWYDDDKLILWWSPDPRFVLFPEKFRISDSFQRKLKKNVFEVRFDAAFSKVIGQCANVGRKDEPGTWITPGMRKAYLRLHKAGYAHSVETYFEGKLVGGLYGVSLGRAFFGESMFHIMPEASKVALHALVGKALEWKFLFIDSQVETMHLKRFGAEHILRADYLKLLKKALKGETRSGCWTTEGR